MTAFSLDLHCLRLNHRQRRLRWLGEGVFRTPCRKQIPRYFRREIADLAFIFSVFFA